MKIYTDIELLKKYKNTNYIFPLLQLLLEKNAVIIQEYQLVNSVQEGDIALFPIAVEFYLCKKENESRFRAFVEKVKQKNKKIVVFTSGDIGYTIKDKDIYTLRLGGFQSKIKNKGWIMPPFIQDPYITLGSKPNYIEKENKPTIGFVGHSNGGIVKLLKEFAIFLRLNLKRKTNKVKLDWQQFYPSSYFRHKYLKMLQHKPELNCKFIFRGKYRAGAKSEIERKKTTLEFYENMNENLYTFCIRGGGNFSVRLYETLAMGRIPIIIDTDSKFPLENMINWKKIAIIVKEKNINHLTNEIKKFHINSSNNELKDTQFVNREIWKNFLTKENYFIHFKNELQNII